MISKTTGAERKESGDGLVSIPKLQQFATMSAHTLSAFNNVIAKLGLQRSILLRSWVDDFVAGRDDRLPVANYAAPWPGINSQSPTEKIQFLVEKPVQERLRARARSLGIEQTTALRAWIEAFCHQHRSTSSRGNTSAAEHGPDESFPFKAPRILKSRFASLCDSHGMSPNHVLKEWMIGLASGKIGSLPVIDDVQDTVQLSAFGDSKKTAVLTRVALPKGMRDLAMAQSRSQGRHLTKTMTLLMTASLRFGFLPDFGAKPLSNKEVLVGTSKPQGKPKRSTIAALASLSKKDTYLTIPITRELKQAFDNHCHAQGKLPATLLRYWLIAYLQDDECALPKGVAGFDSLDAAERDKWSVQSRVGMSRADITSFKEKARLEGLSMSKLVRGWIRGCLA